MPAQYFISLRGSKAELRGLTKQALVKLSSSALYLKACFVVVVVVVVFFWESLSTTDQQLSFTDAVKVFFQRFSICYGSASVLHNPECPLIPCLIVLVLFIFQNSGCLGANFSVKP